MAPLFWVITILDAVLFVGLAAAATLVAAFLPGGPPRQVSDAGQRTESEPSAAAV